MGKLAVAGVAGQHRVGGMAGLRPDFQRRDARLCTALMAKPVRRLRGLRKSVGLILAAATLSPRMSGTASPTAAGCDAGRRAGTRGHPRSRPLRASLRGPRPGTAKPITRSARVADALQRASKAARTAKRSSSRRWGLDLTLGPAQLAPKAALIARTSGDRSRIGGRRPRGRPDRRQPLEQRTARSLVDPQTGYQSARNPAPPLHCLRRVNPNLRSAVPSSPGWQRPRHRPFSAACNEARDRPSACTVAGMVASSRVSRSSNGVSRSRAALVSRHARSSR